MNDTGRLILVLRTTRGEDGWRDAAEWRSLHAASDPAPMPNALAPSAPVCARPSGSAMIGTSR